MIGNGISTCRGSSRSSRASRTDKLASRDADEACGAARMPIVASSMAGCCASNGASFGEAEKDVTHCSNGGGEGADACATPFYQNLISQMVNGQTTTKSSVRKASMAGQTASQPLNHPRGMQLFSGD